MSTQFKDSDGEILTQIIEYANQRYLRESRLHNKSTFNILRVLSAFKETNHQYFNRKDQIYNWILYITKNYNPQTMKEWMTAIAEMLRNRKRISNQYKQKREYYQTIANRTTNQFSYNYQSQNLQNGLNTLSQIIPSRPSINLRPHISRDISSSPSIHQGRNVSGGYNTGNYNSKMHYISFQPNYEDKENIDSQNKKNNGFKQDNQPTKTPIQQSFILNLPNSYGSPFVFSKITNNTINNTKEVTEAEDEEGDEEWTNMKTRATIYHTINLKMKSFSALLANFQAFQSFQFLFKKHKSFQKKMYFRRLSQSYTHYVNIRSIKKRYYDRADNFYTVGLLRKAFKILEIIVRLKIRNRRQKNVDIKKYNRLNVEFILSIMFCPGGEQHEIAVNDTPKSIREKSKYFQNVEDCSKMQLISQYFQCNLKASKQQIANLFQLYRHIRKQRTFNILRMNIRSFSNQLASMRLMRKKLNFQMFASLMLTEMKNKRQVKISDMIKSRKIKQKCFKLLLQFNLSKKIYAKREEFLASKHKELILQRVIKIWKKRLQDQQTKKLDHLARVKEGLHRITKLIKHTFFQELIQAIQIKLQRQDNQQNQRVKQTLSKVFEFMKERTIQRKKSQQLKQRMSRRVKQQVFNNWSRNYKLSIGLKMLAKVISKQSFLKMKEDAQIESKSEKFTKLLTQDSIRLSLKQMRIHYNKERNLEFSKISKCRDAILRTQFNVFSSIICFDQKVGKIQKHKDDVKSKFECVTKFLKTSSIGSSLRYLKKNKEIQQCFKRKQNVVQSVMGNRLIQIAKEGDILHNSQTLTLCHKKLKREAIILMKQNWLYKKSKKDLIEQRKQRTRQYMVDRLDYWRGESSVRKLEIGFRKRLEKKVRAKGMKTLKELSLEIQEKKYRAIETHNKSLRFRTLLGLARAIMYSATLGKQLSYCIECKKRKENWKILMSKLKVEKGLKQNMKKLYKLIFTRNLMRFGKRNLEMRSKNKDITHSRKRTQLKVFFTSFARGKQINQVLMAEDLAFRKHAVYKINCAINRFIVKKKESYMAFKFRALQICRQAFSALYSNCSQKNYQLVHSKKYRILEHISTSYSSI